MATGEIKWSSSGKQVQRFERSLLPKNDYDLKFNASEIAQAKGDKPGQIPYINVPFEALGTATTEGGKNRKLFHRFFLHLHPSEKDGKCMVERQGGLLDLAKALGEDISFSGLLVPYMQYDAGGNRTSEMKRIPIADPAQVLKWLKSKDGAVVRAHVVVDKSGVKNGYDPSNKVDYFIPAEESGTEEGYEMDGEAPAEEPAEELEELEETPGEETPEEEPEAEEDMTATFNPKAKAPAKPAVKAPPAKVKQGPAGKGKK